MTPRYRAALPPRAARRMAKWNKRVRGELTYLEYQIADSIAYTQSR